MKDKPSRFNPFPGLRSFRSDEDHLFFGREAQTLELMARLERNRFIAVVGSSGRGKSSLVRCGLLSRLQGGGMAGAGAHWEIAVMHPGGDPLRHLAEALLEANLYDRAEENAVPHLLATLGRSQFGLVEAVRQAALPGGANFLLVVDQFEEIFRYDEAGAAESELANDFIAMLREACAQTDVPIYVVVTMRSDFIGDCSRFEGLAEAVNRGEYLIPRLSREQFKSAIEGPVRVAGGRIAPRLLQRLLNDVGEEQDQLPCLQHALMRTWRVWQGRAGAEALDLEDYAQVGKMSQALSLHADEVWQSLATDRQRELAAAMFKALTVEGSEKRGMRRPRRVQALCRILEVEKTELAPVIDAFRQPEVSFLVPPAEVELRDATVIDLSHESLMRVWTRLRGWVDEEAQSVGIFRRLSESAALWRQGRTGLCRDPELAIARTWRQANRPNAAWAEQYGGGFDEAMAYLQASTDAAEAENREREEHSRVEAQRKARRQHWLIAGLATAVVGLLVGAFFGIRAQRAAVKQASQTDFILGSRLLDEGKLSDGLAYLVRSGRKDPNNPLVTPRLLSALTAHNFMLPVGAPLKLPSPAIGAAFMSDPRWLGVQSEDSSVRLIDMEAWSIAREYSFPQAVRRGGVVGARDNSDVFAAVLVDNRIVLVDTQTGQPRVAPIVPPGKIFGRTPRIQMSPDGRWLAAAGTENVWVWDSASGRLVATLPNDSYYRGFDFGPDSRSLVTTHEHKVQIRSLPDGAPVGAPIDTPGNTFVTAFNTGGGRLLVDNSDGAFVIDLSTGKPAGPTMPVNQGSLWDLWFGADGERVICSFSNGTVGVREVATGKPLYPALPHRGIAQTGEITADGKVLFTNATDGLFRLWNLETGKLLADPTARQPRFSPASVSRDGRTVVLFAADGNAYRLRLGSGAAAPLALPRRRETTMFLNFAVGSPGRAAWVTPDGLKVVDVASGKATNDGFDFPAHILRATRSSFGTTFGENDVTTVQLAAHVWHAWTIGRNGVAVDVALEDPPDTFGQAIYDAGRKLLIFPGGPAGGPFTQETLGIWDLKTGRRIKNLGAGGAVRPLELALALSPDGHRVLFQTLDDSLVHVDAIETGKELYTLKLDGRSVLTAVCFTPDGSRLISGDDWGQVHVWSTANGQLLRSTPRHRGAINRVEFSADGKYYATESSDGSVQVWNVANDEPVGELLEQTGSAGRPDFTSDGTRIVTPSSTGSARIWDVQTGLPISEPMSSQGDPVTLAAFSPGGHFVTVHGGAAPAFQHVRFWSVPPAAKGPTPDWLLTLATICAGETLTDAGKFADATSDFAKIDDVRRALAAAPDSDDIAGWGRWIISDDRDRPIAPGFTVTPAKAEELAKQEDATPKPHASAATGASTP